jgi:hypothetical protein
MTAETFNEAKAVVQARHQAAIADATAAFERTRDKVTLAHSLRYQLAEHRFDGVKSTPDHPLHDQRREAFQLAQRDPDHTPAHDELDRAVSAADRAYHAELRALASQHGVQIFTGAYPTD